MEYTQKELETMVVGESPNPRAIFFEQACLNVPKSHEAGHRIYDKKIYIKLSQIGLSDSVSYEATKEDIGGYPDEYAYFLKNRQGVRSPTIDIIPNLDIAHFQELRDMGLLTIPQLAEVEIVPRHLEYAHRAAKVFNQALEDTRHDHQENSIEEGHIEEGSLEEGSTSERARDVLTADRLNNSLDVGRPPLPEGDSHREDSAGSQRHETSRPIQRHNGVNWGSNWDMEFKQVR